MTTNCTFLELLSLISYDGCSAIGTYNSCIRYALYMNNTHVQRSSEVRLHFLCKITYFYEFMSALNLLDRSN